MQQSSLAYTLTTSLLTVLLEEIAVEDFETVCETFYVRVFSRLQLECARNNLNRPIAHWLVLAFLEKQMEIARGLVVDAEGVHAVLRIGFEIGAKPSI